MNNKKSSLSLDSLNEAAKRIRRYSILSTTKAGSGHPSSSLSIAELMSVLFFTQFRYDFNDPKRLDNDRFILSKGHAAPALYAAWHVAGIISLEELFSLREVSSNFEGHPTPRLPWIDVVTGSLGQGLANGVGMAFYLQRMIKTDARVYVLMGDGECSEGSVFESAAIATHHKLNNLVAILDVNRLEQSTATKYGWDTHQYASIFQSFGWKTFEIDGHQTQACLDAFQKANQNSTSPSIIIAKTKKGHGVSLMSDQENWHGKALSVEQAKLALKEIGEESANFHFSIQKPSSSSRRPLHLEQGQSPWPHYNYPKEQLYAVRKAFGEALKRLGDSDPNTLVIDGDVKNSTFTDIFEKAHPTRFFQAFIAEQSMAGIATGAGAIGAHPWISTFAAFLTRAYDQLRIAALSQVNLKVCGTHAGVSIGEDGSSQMGLEDIAMFRTLPGSTIVYPADPFATESLMQELSKTNGLSYLRATRATTPILYSQKDKFPIGKSKTLRYSKQDTCAIITAGITLHESLKAYSLLKKEGIYVRVVDAYSVKPIDQEMLVNAVKSCKGNIVVIEDHYIEGGLGDAVLAALAEIPKKRVKKVGITEIPRSGKPEELLELYGLSASRIAETIKAFLQE